MKFFGEASVVLGGFGAQLVMEGLVLSFDIFLPYFLKYFHGSSTALVTLTAAVIQGPAQLLGPASSWLTDQFGGRKVIICCGVGSCLGFVAGSFCTEISHLIAATALIGACFGLASVPAVTATSYHFNGPHRNALTALATTGGAVGAVTFPLFLETLLDTTPWQHVFIFTGGIALQVVICGSLMPSATISKISKREADSNSSLSDDSFGEVCAESLDCKKLTIPIACFLLACFFWSISCYMFDILPLRLDSEGYVGSEIAIILTLQALGYLPGRILAAGAVSSHRIDKILLFSLTILSQGVAMILCSLDGQTFSSYATWAVIIGVGYGITTALIPSVILELVPLKQLNWLYGLQLLVEGFAGCAGAPLSGWLVDLEEGRFLLAYAIAGGLGISGTVFLIPFHWPFSRKTISQPLKLATSI